ncbi:sugar ABC transporter ATP-binding protein [Gemmobacter fulvus]|uniref:Sugar ABC transporter ATP-binding protein n=1 Tax=Gemmobacter fulvus TaxID=2840474 RepID=A0A975PAS5_9RHOB|nr:sugar ABC transporter ATP-binding protein [Gemmobacter fulvus]MBT9244822.1 sugar ABC transporter ATP-binding protein [Gemmobacter fulvus]MDQ1848647.1 sugar ABC transporter ATP-binding protein [Gemmobacter fulvus]QWK91661.1 sugar ABC transporter ATP-binding protein [Gemmobacter fulvus]
MTPVLALSDIRKSFGPIEILHGIDFALYPGEVHALIGENGAGKSTIMKILGGFLAPTSGAVLLEGRAAPFRSGAEAEAAGVVVIHQEFNLAADLTVSENIWLGRELGGLFLDHKAMRQGTQELLDTLESRISPDARIRDLPVSDRQMVELAKALSRNARVLIMDEPSAVLTHREVQILFRQIERLRAAGVALLYTSHRLDEVSHLADRITVLRDGAVVRQALRGELSEDGMATAMVGRDLSDIFPVRRHQFGDIALEVQGFSVGTVVQDVSFALRKGEVLGISGLVGSGRTELAEGLVGLRAHQGTLRRNGQVLHIGSVSEAARHGLAYLTEDRKERGLLLDKTLRENLTLSTLPRFGSPLISRAAEEAALDTAIRAFDIRAPKRDLAVGNLSGGNQQKLLLAKTMLPDPEVVIIDEPTRGIDIGTKSQIYAFIDRLAREGRSVIVISSDMPEVLGLSDRVLVMRQGRVAGILDGAAISETAIVRLVMGTSEEAPAHV